MIQAVLKLDRHGDTEHSGAWFLSFSSDVPPPGEALGTGVQVTRGSQLCYTWGTCISGGGNVRCELHKARAKSRSVRTMKGLATWVG